MYVPELGLIESSGGYGSKMKHQTRDNPLAQKNFKTQANSRGVEKSKNSSPANNNRISNFSQTLH